MSVKKAEQLPRVHPEEVGIDSSAIAAWVDTVNERVGGLHSFMLLRGGTVVAEAWWTPYAREFPHNLFSLSKSFASTAVGLAIGDALLTVDAPVLSFFPDEAPQKPSANLQAMRVRDLLTMSTGHDKDATGPMFEAAGGDWVRGFLSLPVEHEPGSHFAYNSAATYLLSAILQRLTGQGLLSYLTPRLMAPLGIEGAIWTQSPQGIDAGGWGLSIKTEDIARFGQLYLQTGMWEGRRLLPAGWVAEATSRQVSNGEGDASDWTQGYGYQFWRCRHGAYRGDGAFGQYCIVMPAQNAVLAITSGVGNMQAVLDTVWEGLLPAMGKESATRHRTDGDLQAKLATMSVPGPAGAPDSPGAHRINGRIIRFEPNGREIETARFDFRDRKLEVTLTGGGVSGSFTCGFDAWTAGVLVGEGGETPIASRYAWEQPDRLVVASCLTTQPFVESLTFQMNGDEVTLQCRVNVSFGPTEEPPICGKVE